MTDYKAIADRLPGIVGDSPKSERLLFTSNSDLILDAAEAITELLAEREEFRQGFIQQGCEAAKLRAALEKYGRHDDDCPMRRSPDCELCTCGLDEVLSND